MVVSTKIFDDSESSGNICSGVDNDFMYDWEYTTTAVVTLPLTIQLKDNLIATDTGTWGI